MSTRLYKNGRLTADAKKKLSKRLQKENKKPKHSKLSKKQSSKATPIKSVKKEIQNKIETEIKTKTKTKIEVNTPTKKNVDELTVDDIEDTPPRNKLVMERNQAMNVNNDVNWIQLVAYNQKEAENEKLLYTKLEKNSNNRFKKHLDEQKQIKFAQYNDALERKNKYKNQLNEQYKKYINQDKIKEHFKHQQMLKLKKIRCQQVEELKRKRKYQELKLRKHELRDVEKLKIALKQEKIEKEVSRNKNISKLKQMLVDNEEQKKIKLKQKKKDEFEAIRLQKEYAEMLKEQEKKRAKQFAETYEKQQQKFQALISATADILEKAEEDAKRAEIEQKRRMKLEDYKEKAKKDKLNRAMEECKISIDKQIIEKNKRIKQNILDDKAYGEKMKILHREYLNEIEQNKINKLNKQKEQSIYLEKQILELEKKKLDAKTEMSITEKLLNKKLLDQVRITNTNPPVKNIKIDPRAPYQWRYAYRKAPF